VKKEGIFFKYYCSENGKN